MGSLILGDGRDEVSCVAALPNGNVVCGYGRNDILRLWDTNTGAELRTFEGHTNWVRCVISLPDGRIVSGSADSTLCLWNTETGAIIRRFISDDEITCVASLPNNRLVSGNFTNNLTVWAINTGAIIDTFIGHTDVIRGVVCLPNGLVVSCSNDHTLRLWDTRTGATLQTFEGHTESVDCVAALDDDRIVSGSFEGLRLWDTATGATIRTFDSAAVSCVRNLSNGRIVSGDLDGKLTIWNIKTGDLIQRFEKHEQEILCVTSLPDDRIVSGSYDSLRVWEPIASIAKYSINSPPVRNIPQLNSMGIPVASAITLNDIKEGNTMVNFPRTADKTEYNFGEYFSQEAYNRILTPKLNPFTRKKIDPKSVKRYRAHLVSKNSSNRFRNYATRNSMMDGSMNGGVGRITRKRTYNRQFKKRSTRRN